MARETKEVQDLSWGKPDIYAAPIVGGAEGDWFLLPPSIEGSTTMEVTKGDKKEAKVEGGDVEIVKYNKNTYALVTEIRYALEDKGLRKKPFTDDDGIVGGIYAIKLVPENPEAAGVYIRRAKVSMEPSYSSEDGINLKYTFDALRTKGNPTCEFGVVTPPDVSSSSTSASTT